MADFEQILDEDCIPFDALNRCHQTASDQHADKSHRLHVSISGGHVCIEIVGNALAEAIGQAFAHIRCEDRGEPALSIRLWDEQETGIKLPQNPNDARSRQPNIVLKATADGRFIGEERRLGSLWFDRNENVIVGYTASAATRFLDERARPFHRLLSLWLSDRGIQFIHSGLIAHEDKGILFVGNGGAGKSTSSIACLQHGFQYLGDDFVGVQKNADNSFSGHGFFASCMLNVDHLKRFPDLKAHAQPAFHSHEDKSVIYLQDRFQNCLQSLTRIHAIVLPRVVDSETTTFQPATKAHALFAIAPTSVMFLPTPNKRALDRLAELVEGVPAYWLELGRDIQGIPQCVERLVDGVAA